jgi:hypothetical protein
VSLRADRVDRGIGRGRRVVSCSISCTSSRRPTFRGWRRRARRSPTLMRLTLADALLCELLANADPARCERAALRGWPLSDDGHPYGHRDPPARVTWSPLRVYRNPPERRDQLRPHDRARRAGRRVRSIGRRRVTTDTRDISGVEREVYVDCTPAGVPPSAAPFYSRIASSPRTGFVSRVLTSNA